MTLYLGGDMTDTHVLYTDEDFTTEELARYNHLALAVVQDGRRICKKCGAGDEMLVNLCGAKR